ncbi:aldo/keto reductase [Sphingomonas sp. KR1UV-12]|uniref:Aldo/keto reductase n=1 Tax=Sphingomonas aurea TaxID=3063994 RepID=A0ABT9EJE3_9SPHN|nr:aldo/keto reductase [Sphingomonas sp. KR1UV-12]MDP1027056.1 aldo/keto reductase [Sphingomonas sp. KR1UV-12]
MIFDEAYTLAGGVAIPKLGLGTWRIDDDAVGQVVRAAIAIGFRHVDTAQAYGNERGVGEGLRATGVARDALFVTTKLAAESKSYLDAKARIDGSLRALGLDHVDLMLIHSPQPWAAFREGGDFDAGNLEAWRALEEAHHAGKIRAIGVSNFERADLDNILRHGTVRPAVNQVLAHVGNTPFDLIDYCREQDVLVEAYSPIAHGAALAKAELKAMAAGYGVDVAQLCIRYCLQLGLLPVPKSTDPDHLRSNAAVDFAIGADDMARLTSLSGDVDYGEASAFPVFGKPRQVPAANTNG